MILVVGHEKGGVGKSSLAINFAYRIAVSNPKKPLSVILVDTDTTSTSTDWYNIRSHYQVEPVIPVLQSLANSAPAIINMSAAHDAIIVDVGARDYDKIGDLARIADLWIAPTQVGQGDLDSTIRLHEAIRGFDRRHKNGRVPLCFVMNRAPSGWNSSEEQDAREYLEEASPGIPVLKAGLRDRKIWRDAGKLGRSILEMPRRDAAKAVDEFEAVFLEAMSFQDRSIEQGD